MASIKTIAYTSLSDLFCQSFIKGSILSVFKQKIKLFASRENLSEMLSHSDFELADIGLKKTAVFIIIQDEKKTYHSLATILVKQCYETLIDVAQDNGGKLPIRTNFLLDEFANMPPLKDVTTMITAARSRSIRFTLIIQNFAQLNQVYGKDNAETIKGNCGNLVYLISSELAALEEISKMCGEVKSKEKDKTASTPLVTVSDLQRMKMWEVIIIRSRLQPFKTKFTPDFKINWGKKYEKGNYPVRNKQAISLFDLKGFVKKQKQEKLSSMMENVGSNDDMVYNPFLTNNNPPQNTFIPPYISNSNEDEKTNNINIEDLVKKIDARIAELEEEERREQNQTVKKDIDPFKDFQDDNIVIQNDININNISKPDEGVLQTKDLEEEMPLPSEESVNEKSIEIKPIETIDNDDFFDDFFDN